MNAHRFVAQTHLARWARTSTHRAREIVLEVLKSSHPIPIRSQDIYQRVMKEYAGEKVPIPPIPPPLPVRPMATNGSGKKKEKVRTDPPEPPHPDHPVRSLKFLKTVVLEELAQRKLIEKVHSMREPTAEELAHKNERYKKGKKRKAAAGTAVHINVKGMIDQWGWALKTAEDLEVEKQQWSRVEKAIEGQKLLDKNKAEENKRKQFEEEWGHLNTRRRRARSGKLEREEQWARLLESGRQEGRAEAEQRTD